MKNIDNQRGSGLAAVQSITFFALAFAASSACADDTAVAIMLKAKGAEVTAAKGVITAVAVQDGSKLDDDDFRRLTQLTHLQTLSLSNGLNDARLTMLAGLPRLEYLQSNLAQISDGGIKPLAQMKSLRNLKFFHPGKEFSGAGLAHLAELPNLERLTVAGSLAFNDDGMAAVAKLTGLKEFRTWHAGPTLAGVKQLTALKNLKSLHLGQRLTYKPPACPNDDTITVLAEMKSLESLIIDEARLTLPALQQLKQLPNLKNDALRHRYSPRGRQPIEARSTGGEGRMDGTQPGISKAHSSALRCLVTADLIFRY